MEGEEQLHDDPHEGNDAPAQVDSAGETASEAPDDLSAEKADHGSLPTSNAFVRDNHNQAQLAVINEGSVNLPPADQKSFVRPAAPVNELDNRERNGNAQMDPVIGMAFETENAAYDCYSEYAKKMGFTIRWDNRTLSRRTGVTLARRFVCSKQGRRGDGQKKRHSQAKYHREETRCGCLAYMKIKLAGDGKYRIIELNATHNHPLASQVPFNYTLANLVLYNHHPLANQVPGIHPVPIQIANLRSLPNQVPNIRPVSIQVPSIHHPLPPATQVPSVHPPAAAQASGIRPRPNQVPYNHPVAVFVPIGPQQVQSHHLAGKSPGNQHAGHVVIMQRVPGAQGSASGKTKRKRKAAVSGAAADDDDKLEGVSPDVDPQITELEGLGNLPADARNYLPVKRTNPMQKSDVDSLLEYFRSKQARSSSFFYSFQLDLDEKITNVFWMDGRMKTDYARFGDVLCFDTTYRMNDYGRPLALFVGVNHHKQMVVFGAALIYDETAYSFRWVFRSFLEAVSGKRPATLLTDESAAILSAAASEFRGTPHRLCVWHLYQNATKNLAKVFTGSKDFDDDFGRCIYDHEVEADFVQGWNAMLEKYNLVENSWLRHRFRERERWAPAHGQAVFCADIHSAQHRERMNRELRRYLSSARDMESFLQGFDRFLDDRRSKELEASSKMTKSSPYAPPVSIIQQAARVYTAAAFDMFMAEYVAGLECLVRERKFDGSAQILTVEDGRGHKHAVKVNLEEETLSCSCSKFDRAGILCGHVLTCITKKLRSIPDRYILRRWTRCAGNVSPSSDPTVAADVDDQRDLLSWRYGSLVHDFVQLSVRAAEDEEIYSCALKHKEAMSEEMEKLFKEKTSSLSYHLFGEHVW